MESLMQSFKVKAYGTEGALIKSLSKLSRMEVERQPPKSDEILIDVLFCGVCHSDLHQIKNDWNNTLYPCVPGHEVVGRIVSIGNNVTKFRVGDTVGVGCMIDSCGHCHSCQEGEEQYCEGPVSWTATYNGYMKPDGSGYNTFGGYSTSLVVKESYVLRIPEALDVQAAAPILCAGVTTYSPLKHWGIKPGDKVGVVGIGGLGHMAVMIAKAMGAHVTAITTQERKREDALKLGADEVIVSEKSSQMKAGEKSLDFILITIPDKFKIDPYVTLLKRDGHLVTVGLLGPYDGPLNNQEIAFQRRSVSGSLIGSIAETQEVLDFCAEHGIKPDTQLIAIQNINEAYTKMQDEEVRFRYVIDMQTLKDEE